MAVIEAVGLKRSYGPVRAVDGVTLQVDPGEVVALLGPNGAGKTTTVEMLEGYRRPDEGSVRVLGLDPFAAGPALRDRIGIVLQQSGIERELTVREALDRLTMLYSQPAPVEELIATAGLDAKADQRIKTLSGGQRRRLDLAAALAGSPDLLFLDEPTTGFDPEARREAWGLVRQLTAGGTTVLLTTHYLDEAQALADRVVVMAKGRVVAEGDPDSLGGRETARARIRFRLPEGLDPADLPPMPGEVIADGGRVEVVAPDPTPALHLLTGWALDRGLSLEGLEVLRPTLEDVYLQMVGGGPQAGGESQ